MYNGDLSTLSDKWHVCDGTNGTPDLRDRFIVGAGSSYGLGNIGGVATVQLSEAQLPSHRHSLNNNFILSMTFDLEEFDSGSYSGSEGGKFMMKYDTRRRTNMNTTLSGYTDYTGSNQAHENRPPYYALYYIMKIQK